MHPRVSREGVEQIREMLTDIFNSLLDLSQIQDDWRVANVTLLFKKGSREEWDKDKAVSLTSEWDNDKPVSGEGDRDIN